MTTRLHPKSAARLKEAVRGEQTLSGLGPEWQRTLDAIDRNPDLEQIRPDYGELPEDQWTDAELVDGADEFFFGYILTRITE